MDIFLGILTFLGLYAAKLYSYPLFHSLAELFSVVIACGIFVIAWNTRRIADNHYLLFIGIAYLFVSSFDLAHMLAYKGMGVFTGYAANTATQLWIAARYLQSLSLLFAPFFLQRKLKVSAVFIGYIFVACLLFLSIFVWKVFPDCFVEGAGLTAFKIASEYTICAILLIALAILFQSRAFLDGYVLKLLSASIILTMFSELSFTLYIDVYGFFNMLGHCLKVVAFYLVYKAIIERGLTQPYTTIFRDLKRNEALQNKLEEEQQIILDSVPAWIFHKDQENRFLKVNKVFAEIMEMSKEQLEGKSLFDIYPREQAETLWRDDKNVMASGESQKNIIGFVDTTKGRRWVQTDKIPYRDTHGNIIGVIGFSIDITERKRMEEEREKLISELQKALSKVKKLSGLLPICASCKKIRNDDGYWEQIEGYIKDHSEAEFSHGICPECIKKLYPEYHNAHLAKKKQDQ
jgi:PAS domain S-box-containing protein